MQLDQHQAPLYEAMEAFRANRVVPFDVPGHKRGRGNPELVAFLGERAVSCDVNSQKPLDYLSHPVSVIKDAEELMADAFGAKHAFLMVGGTTQSVQTMVLTACKPGDAIILPRNVHKSVLNALVLCGAKPIYVNPGSRPDLGIALGMTVADVKATIAAHPEAVGILINNPTYYGICSDLRGLVDAAHEAGLLALVDEAHGTHLYFGSNLPLNAMAAGADMAAVSMHKSGGSLTQSSVLLMGGDSLEEGQVRRIINLMQTTSASYLLMTSLDITRRKLALQGEADFAKVVDLAEYARREINAIGGYYAYSRELINGSNVFDFDVTKLAIQTTPIGLAGVEVYNLLRDEYEIQMELGDTATIIAYISVGDRRRDIERLVSALEDIKFCYGKSSYGHSEFGYVEPQVVLSPQEAFYATTKTMPLEQAAGYVSAEFVMSYPPGIPVLAPGERITAEIIDYIHYGLEMNALMTGTKDPLMKHIEVVEEVK